MNKRRGICGAGRLVQGAPECMSYVFDADGKCTSFTGGYIMDRRVGNTCKLGAMLGILKAIGARVPEPGSLTWSFFMLVQRTVAGVKGARRFQSIGHSLILFLFPDPMTYSPYPGFRVHVCPLQDILVLS